MNYVSVFLSLEVVVFGIAALVHTGLLVPGYEHRDAMIAETVIAIVLLLGLVAGAAAPRWTRSFGLGAQGFALLGTCVGIFTIVVGVGPQSGFDLALHTVMVALLITGLIVVARSAGIPRRV